MPVPQQRLTGTIPTELGLLTEISDDFELGSNSLSGTIPSELGQMTLISDDFELVKSCSFLLLFFSFFLSFFVSHRLVPPRRLCPAPCLTPARLPLALPRPRCEKKKINNATSATTCLRGRCRRNLGD